MKRINHVFDEIVSIDNLRKAHYEAKMSRRPCRRKSALRFEKNLECNLLRLHEELVNETWMMHPYRCMVRVERGKHREIYYSPYHEDSLVQHAIMRVLGRRIEKTFIRDVYASIPGRGSDDGIRRLRHFLDQIPASEPIRVWKIDIRKYYQSISHAALFVAILAVLKDQRAIRLLFRIIRSHDKGIPIGNALSPLFANLLLSEFDHFIKEHFHIKGYFRYLDDVVAVVTGENAHEILKAVSAYAHEYLEGIGLIIKPNEQIYPIERGGIDFLGYVFGRRVMLLRRKTERRFLRAVRRYKQHKTEHNRMTLSSYWGMLKRMPYGLRLWFTYFSVPIQQLEVSA